MQCLQVGVPRPRPAWFSTILCHLQPCQHSSPGEWFDLPGQSLALFDLIVHLSSIPLQANRLSGVLPGSSLSFTWSCLFASHHDLFRCSQTSIVCFEYCSVHFPEVCLLFVLQLVGVRVFSFFIILLFRECPLNQASPFVSFSFCESLIQAR